MCVLKLFLYMLLKVNKVEGNHIFLTLIEVEKDQM